jgi:hypothetical protein
MTDELAGDKKLKKLRLIGGRSTPSPPCALGAAGQALWDRIMNDYAVTDAGGVELLSQAAQAADRVASLRRQIDETGELIPTRAGLRDNPGLKHEIAARAFITRTICKLGLAVEPLRPGVGRPGATFGITDPWKAS